MKESVLGSTKTSVSAGKPRGFLTRKCDQIKNFWGISFWQEVMELRRRTGYEDGWGED
jgi:hypothetical protein